MQGYWNTQTDEEVLKTLRINELTFIGKFKKYEKVSLFENIRNLDYSPVLNLKSNLDDRNFVKVQIINKTTFDLQTDLYYKITAQIIPQKIRKLHNSEFLLEFNKNSIFEIYNPNEQEFTELIFKKYSEANTSNSQDILRSVKTITYQINKRNETFIYELLQNADDYPVYRNKVTVDFYITDKYLLFTHSGAEFRFNNVYSLCAVNAEDKVDEKDKIGFKGIGFKSVFKANEFVYLKSGKYSFRFDKAFHHAEYPWQLMPVYTKQEDLEISLKNNTRFLNSNVAIALKPRNSESVLLEYSKTLELFSDDRILLFLRNVEKVNVFLNNDKKIFCVKNDNKWWLKDFKVKVNQDVTEYLNKQINEGNEEIPSKFANLTSCKISFAASINDRQITLLNDAKLFNYLPLSINLNLPFLINSDFIPDGEREGLTSNEWNEFLLKEAGIQFVNFIVSTISDPKREKKFCYSILRLIPLFNEISDTLKNNEKWNSYFEFFKEGFQSSILGNNAKSFIPNEKGILVPLSNTLIDETGVADFLQEEFSQLTSITQELIHKEVGEGIGKVKSLINEYKEGKIYTVKNLKTDLQSPKFQEWLKIPTNNFKLIQYLSTNTDLAELLKTEKIILSETNQLSKAELLFNQIPKELTFITAEVINKELLALLEKHEISLSLKSFDAVKFYTENLLGKQNIINASLKDELSLLNFWRFIFDNWDLFEKEKTIKESLKNFQILCKSESENEFSKKLISEVYLSNDFNKENEIESILRNLEINDTSFISNKYIDEKRDADKWRKIFKQAAAKTDLQEVIATLIQKLPNIEGYKHFEIAKQVFRFWKENRDTANKLTDTQISLLKINLKIKCSDNEFRHASKCFISDYFNNNTLIASLLPQIELKSQITNDYGANITDGNY